MVNRLRLSPLSELRQAPRGAGVHPLALALFGGTVFLVALGIGIHFLGDPHGGSARAQVTLDLRDWDYQAMLRRMDGQMATPMVLRGRSPQTTAPEPEPAPEPSREYADLDGGRAPVVRVTATGDVDEAARYVIEDAAVPPPRRRAPAREPLRPAPVAALQEDGPHGPMPVIAADGRRASQVYARPFNTNDTRPRVALVIGGLGLNAQSTEAAIVNLPEAVTLSFVPYAENLQHWIDLARANGHEVMLEFPMEPFDYPENNPGPATLLTSHTPEERSDKLAWLYGRASGYVGVMNYQGARFTANEDAFAPVLEDLNNRGLLYLDDGTSQRSIARRIGFTSGGAVAVANQRIDLRPRGQDIAASLDALASAAAEDGVAIGVGFAYPVTVEEILRWSQTLDAEGLTLAPLSAAIAPETS